jgi:hypothetical protein
VFILTLLSDASLIKVIYRGMEVDAMKLTLFVKPPESYPHSI